MQNDDVSAYCEHISNNYPFSIAITRETDSINFSLAGYLEHYQQIVLLTQSQVRIDTPARRTHENERNFCQLLIRFFHFQNGHTKLLSARIQFNRARWPTVNMPPYAKRRALFIST